MPLLQEEVDCAFSRVKKEAAPGKDGSYLPTNDDCCCFKISVACLVWGMLEKWFDALRTAKELGGSGYQKTVW